MIKILDQKILNAKKELAEWRKELILLEDEKFEKEEKPRLQAMIGKCFKTTNNFSCPEKPEDYWFLYSMIIGLDGKHIIVNRFQKDRNNRCEFFIKEIEYENILGVEITKKEYNDEFKKVIKYILSELDASDGSEKNDD